MAQSSTIIYELEDGSKVAFEVQSNDLHSPTGFSEGIERVSRGLNDTPENLARSFEKDFAKPMHSMLKQFSEKIKDLNPDELSLEFNIKMGGTTGFIFAAGSAEANFKVSATWKSAHPKGS